MHVPATSSLANSTLALNPSRSSAFSLLFRSLFKPAIIFFVSTSGKLLAFFFFPCLLFGYKPCRDVKNNAVFFTRCTAT